MNKLPIACFCLANVFFLQPCYSQSEKIPGKTLSPPSRTETLQRLDSKYNASHYREEPVLSLEIVKQRAEIQAAEQQGDLEKAGKLHETQLSRFPTYGQAYVDYISFLLKRDMLPDAYKVALRGLKYLPKHPQLLLVRDQYERIQKEEDSKRKEWLSGQLKKDFQSTGWIQQKSMFEELMKGKNPALRK